MRRRLLGQFERLGEEGFRVLGVASRGVDRAHDTAVVGDETELIFAGFAVFVDPPKAERQRPSAALAAGRGRRSRS